MTSRRFGGGVLAATAVVWLLLGVGLVAVVVLDGLTLDDSNCPVPGLDSVYGEASWQWWPPGEVCSVGGNPFTEPSALRSWLLVGEVVLTVVLVVLWRRWRDAPEPDWAA